MRFTINLATRIYINARSLKLYTAAAVGVLAFLVYVNAANIAVKFEEMKRLANEIAALEGKSKTATKAVPEKEYRALLDRINFANAVIEKKTYSWLSLLDKLELVVPDGVAISSIEPDTKNKGLKLSGIARSFTNLRIFMERLEESNFFTDVYLMSQSDVKVGDKAQGITFNLTCKVTKK